MSIFSNFISKANKKYGQVNPLDWAKNIFKDSADIGTAVVSVISSTGIAGFKFHVPQTEMVKMESEVTDHYVDDNTVVQDHIIQKPVTITLTGLQGDYFYSVNELEDKLVPIKSGLTLVTQFIPKLSAATMQAKMRYKNNIDNIRNNPYISPTEEYLFGSENITGYAGFKGKSRAAFGTLNGIDLFQLFQNLIKLKSAQTRAFFFLEALWRSSAVFTVETTWKRYNDMVITSLQPVRDNNADITDFTVTFKQIRKTASLSKRIDVAGRVNEQMAKQDDKGVDKGKQTETIK